MIAKHIELAGWFAEQVAEHPDLEVVGPTHFGLVCLRVHDEELYGEELDLQTESLHFAINENPRQYVTHTRLDGRYTIRVSIGQWQTEREHVERLWDSIAASCEQLKRQRSTE
jgi:aromatic-L-amino-acid decarboxylase